MMFRLPVRPLGISLALLLGALAPGMARAADLTVVLDGVAHDRGGIRVGLYDRAETFRKEDRAVLVRKAPAVPGRVALRIEGLPPGRYAIMAYHDEDGDGGLDRFMGVIPTEGYALSNDPEVTGPPAFDDCAFDLPPAGREMVMPVRY